MVTIGETVKRIEQNSVLSSRIFYKSKIIPKFKITFKMVSKPIHRDNFIIIAFQITQINMGNYNISFGDTNM